MSHLAQVPPWGAVLVALLVLLGSGLTLIGALGLVRLGSFYDRIHAPTLGTSWGTAAIMLASALMFSLAGGRVFLHEVIIAPLVMMTTPVTLMILARAALFRGDRSARDAPQAPDGAAAQAPGGGDDGGGAGARRPREAPTVSP